MGVTRHRARARRATRGAPVSPEAASPMRLFQAPGRVNLIGDHTDYMGGTVLPMAIDRGTWLATQPRADRLITATSVNLPEVGTVTVQMDGGRPAEGGDWANYLVAMVYALTQRGAVIPHGFDVHVYGSIPNGAGLSSSASLEMAFGVALNEWFDLGFTPTELAVAGRVAENEFIGVSSGIMDQLAIATGRRGYALAMDCEALTVEHVPMPDDDVVVVANSRKRRELVDSAYNERRASAEAAEEALGVGRLVDIAPDDLPALLNTLDPALRPRPATLPPSSTGSWPPWRRLRPVTTCGWASSCASRTSRCATTTASPGLSSTRSSRRPGQRQAASAPA